MTWVTFLDYPEMRFLAIAVLGDVPRLPCNALPGYCSLPRARRLLYWDRVVALSAVVRQQSRVSTATSVPTDKFPTGKCISMLPYTRCLRLAVMASLHAPPAGTTTC